jgi:hypothetical protein
MNSGPVLKFSIGPDHFVHLSSASEIKSDDATPAKAWVQNAKTGFPFRGNDKSCSNNENYFTISSSSISKIRTELGGILGLPRSP